MVSPTAAQKLIDAGKESDILLNPVGTGPFKLVSFQPSVSLKYTKFADYWQKGLPYLDAIEISIVADKVVALTSFTKGEADVFYGVGTNDAKSLKDKGNTIKTSTLTIMGICGDSKNSNSPFAQQIVREAIAYAIDRDTIVNTVFKGMSPPTNQLALPGFQAYNSSIQSYPYNEQKAKDLLKIAGYDTAHPLTTKLTYMADPERADLYTLVQSYLAKVGINITLEPIEFAAFNKFNQAGWNNQLLQYSFSYNGLEMQYSTSVNNNLYGGKLSYVSVYAPADFDTLFTKAKAETDLAKRETYYEQLNKMAIDDYCLVIPLFGFVRLTANSAKVHDCGFAYRAPIEFLPEMAWKEK
jgi:peptide/nickel transport system substrate-binding protein